MNPIHVTPPISPRTHPRLSRRRVLQAGLAAGTIAVAAPTIGFRPAGARTGGIGGAHRIVVVYLRGGQDHLSTVVPADDPDYERLRGDLAIDPDVLLPLDDRFGFHPALARLKGFYDEGRLAPVVATGNPAGDRSHFTAQDLSEYGSDVVPDDGLGWLARCLHVGSGDSPFRGLSMGANVTRSFAGFPALGLSSIESFGLGGQSGLTARIEPQLRAAYEGDRAVETTGQAALTAIDDVEALTGSTANDETTRHFEDLATLLDADVGVEVASINLGGWDTHDQMGNVDGGEMAGLLASLDASLAAFQDDLDGRGVEDVTTIVMTEFGRRVARNGSGGADHGWGSAMLVLGNSVAGGEVHGDWKGLGPDVIGERGDVPVFTDFRDVLGDVVALSGHDPATIFPGHSYTPVGIAE